jgi:hypothetical protein
MGIQAIKAQPHETVTHGRAQVTLMTHLWLKKHLYFFFFFSFLSHQTQPNKTEQSERDTEILEA